MSAEEETGEPPERMIDDLDEFFESVPIRGLVAWAEGGDMGPLIAHIEGDGEVVPVIREFLVRHLRGEVPKRPGNIATKAMDDRNSQIGMDVYLIMRILNVSLYKAQNLYLERHPRMNRETLKSIIRSRRIPGKGKRKQ